MTPEPQGVRCRACGGEAAEVLALPEAPVAVQTLVDPGRIRDDRSVALRVCRCAACGLVQLGDDPDLARTYSPEYLCAVNFSEHARAYQEDLAGRWVRGHGLSRGRVLEVGGGDGFFAAMLQERGCDVTLIDPAPRACRAARDRGLGRVVEGYLGPGTFPGEVFDAVVARHVLEHVTRPIAFLRLLSAALRPGGLMFVEVPNLDAIVANRRFQDFYAEHVSYFDPSSLASAMAGAGLEVVGLETIEGGDYLAAVARVPGLGFDAMVADLGAQVDRFRVLAEESRGAGRRLAVWGAGGRCVALLSLIRARELGVAYVVDSDPKKWGLVTPATHLPVVPPARLETDPVDDLLVAATAFQDEILGGLGWFRRAGGRLGVVQPEPRWIGGGETGRARDVA